MARKPSKRKRDEWTPEARRMSALLGGLRDEKGWTQERLAKALDVDQSYISLLIACDPDAPRGIGADLVRLAYERLHVNPWYFFWPPRDEVPDWHEYHVDTEPPGAGEPPSRTGVRTKAPSTKS